ncbi:MAG: ABC transporter ATP-binding protein [Alphaproteobacteria bacterium]|nr:ABC transporter ATP-binding protein [Alphaproteobacteria bacterium]
MIRTIIRAFQLVHPEHRWALFRLLPAMCVVSILDLFVVTSAATFIRLLARPERLTEMPWLSMAWQASGMDQGPFLSAVGFVVVGLVLAGNTFAAHNTYRVQQFCWSQVTNMGEDVLRSYLNRPYAYFLAKSTPELSHRILVEVQYVVKAVLIGFLTVAARAVGAALVIGWLVWQDPMLSVVLVATLGSLYGVLFMLLKRLLYRVGRVRSVSNKWRHQLTAEALVGVKEIKLYGQEEVALARFREPSDEFADAQAKANAIAGMTRFLLEGVAFGAVLVVVLYYQIRGESLDGVLVMLGSYAIAGLRLLPTFQVLLNSATRIQVEEHALDLLYEDLTTAPEPVQVDDSVVVPFEESIALRDVTFQYPTAEKALFEGLELEIKKGAWVAFVGSTGSGKTTLVDLLMGLLTPDSGTLCVDDHVLSGPDEVIAWQRHLGYAPQSLFMSDTTIARNIAFGESEPDIERVRRSAEVAALAEFIEAELPKGYDTEVGERGLRLSGGQRQRVGLARALYRDSDILVLDEATSALDNRTEARVMQELRSARAGSTVLMIAHRLSTTRHCDEIIVLEQGRIVDRGSYDDLAQRSARFQEMLRAAAPAPEAVA